MLKLGLALGLATVVLAASAAPAPPSEEASACKLDPKTMTICGYLWSD